MTQRGPSPSIIRLFVTLGVLALFRFGAHVPSPFLTISTVDGSGPELGRMLQLKGLQSVSLFGLGVMPYVTAALLLSLLTRSVPYLQQLKQSGPQGVLRARTLTRWAALAISMPLSLANLRLLTEGSTTNVGVGATAGHVLFQVTGLLVLLALAEQVTRHGMGNGVSVLLVATVLSGVAPAVAGMSGWSWTVVAVFAIFTALSVVAIVVANGWVHQEPVYPIHPQTAGGQISTESTKATCGGAGPLLFAGAIMVTFGSFLGLLPLPATMRETLTGLVDGRSTMSLVLLAVLTAGFARVYVNVVADPVANANMLMRSGRFLQGSVPGVQTARKLAATTNAAGWLYAGVLLPVALWPALLQHLGGEAVPASVSGSAVVIPALVMTEILGAHRRAKRS
jgi:preprotein translocase subunit SecY